MTFEDYISKLEKRAQLPQYMSSNYENSFSDNSSEYTKEYTNSLSSQEHWSSSSYENVDSFTRESVSSMNYENASSPDYLSQYKDIETSRGPITDRQSTTDGLLQDVMSVRSDITGKFINIKNDFVTDVKTSKLNHSFGMVIDPSELYETLKEKLEESPIPEDLEDDYKLNESGQKVHSLVTKKNLINNRTVKNVLYKITTYTEGKITNNSIPLRINGKTIDSQFSEKTVDGKLQHLYHNFNLESHDISQRNTDDESGIFAKTAFNPKNESTGRVDQAKKEQAYKTHLRNYWKLTAGNNSSGAAFYGFGNMQTTADNGYRQRLIDRLAGVSDSDKNVSDSKNFLAGPGVDTETYMTNMGVGDLMSLGGLKLGSWQSTGGLPQTVLNDVDALRYGTPEKKDLIIDSGRFKANSLESKTISYDLPETGPKRRIYALMRSSFGADAMRTPHYRRQMLALGNEVNLLNAFVDADRITKTSYRIGFIDEGNGSSARADTPRSSKHAAWAIKNGDKVLWSNSSTAIGKLLRRMPDFMGNMYNVYFTLGNKVVTSGDGKAGLYDRENSKNYKNKYIKNEIKLEDSLKRYFNPDMFFSNVFAARCTGIQVKLPELKANSMPVLGRKVAYIDSNIIFSREGAISIRLDETFDIYKGILSQAGVEYRFEKQRNLLNDTENYFINKVSSQYTIMDSLNEQVNNSNRQLDIHVRYDMVNSMVPTDKLEKSFFPVTDGPAAFSPSGKAPYFREFVFTNVKFLGAGDLELSKDSDITEMSFPFIYADIYEVISGHDIVNKSGNSGNTTK